MSAGRYASLLMAAAAALFVNGWAQTFTPRELFYTPEQTPAPVKPVDTPVTSTQPKKTVTAKKKTVSPKTEVAKDVPTEPRRTPETSTPTTTPTLPNGGQLVTAAHAQPIPLGLRYSLLRSRDDSAYEEVDPETIFRSGDRLR